MLVALVFFLQQVNVKKFEKLATLAEIEEENRHVIIRDLINFIEIFRKNETFDHIKSHKRTGFQPLSRKQYFGKTREGQFDTPAFSGLK